MTGPVQLPRRGLMLILSSPSGAGKTTLSRLLLEGEQEQMTMSVSVTTRARRPSEIDGRDYHFIDQSQFDRMVRNDELLEHAGVFDHSYGTPRDPVERALTAGKDVLFDIDWQGTQQLMHRARRDLVAIFILPPSIAELERRLRARAQDSEDTVQRRMARAHAEIEHWREYDYVIVNKDVQHSLESVQAILRAERLRRDRQLGVEAFVAELNREEAPTAV